MATSSTTTRLLAEVLLERDHGTDLAGFVAARRPGRSWRLIARDLWEATGGNVDVSGEALRKWCGGPPAQRRPGSTSTSSTERRQAS